jgi:hypothetical protein
MDSPPGSIKRKPKEVPVVPFQLELCAYFLWTAIAAYNYNDTAVDVDIGAKTLESLNIEVGEEILVVISSAGKEGLRPE